jgi:hypothetical protein
MTRKMAFPLVVLALALAVALFGPLKPFGNNIAQGAGDFLNGLVVFSLLLIAAMAALAARRKGGK